jgi:dTDP-4-dehydrorhamnose 3,5-epimerase
MFTVRPGTVKGWGLHKLHEDRYFVVDGEMEVVMYDPRPESSTCGQIFRIVLSAARPRLMNIPRFVWHADRNIGTGDVRAINFPTMQYDHANPDKYRLPLDTDLIPFDFGGLKGW